MRQVELEEQDVELVQRRLLLHIRYVDETVLVNSRGGSGKGFRAGGFSRNPRFDGARVQFLRILSDLRNFRSLNGLAAVVW